MFKNIPEELQQCPAWVVWRHVILDNGKITKHPHNARTGHMASVTNPDDWSTYDEAVAAALNYDGIGFVLSNANPYTVIDLDATDDPGAQAFQAQILGTFKSYVEISPSGRGKHIWIKGSVPTGRRKGPIELYSTARYMTVTGNVDGPALPIQEAQEKLTSLYNHLTGTVAGPTFEVMADGPEKYPDDTICDRAAKAKNGQKFIDLHQGDWQQLGYPSQSEADLALISMLAFYTDNREQIIRIFRASALGQRDKAQRNDYVGGMVTRAFDRKPKRMDINKLKAILEAEMTQEKSASAGEKALMGLPSNRPVSTTTTTDSAINPYLVEMPGLTGEIARFIYNSAPRPVYEIAVAGALGLMAGITGRAWNISATGLNQYFLLLSDTGTGKEAMASGINRLISALGEPQANGIGLMPSASQFIGPSEVASGQAITKYISSTSKSFVSIFGEFDTLLRRLHDPRASTATQKLRQFLLDIYSKSGAKDVLGDMIYADKDKNTGVTKSPAFSILGECTPDRLYQLLDGGMIADGFLPRFTIIEYTGARVDRNKAAGDVIPSDDLLRDFAQLCGHASNLNQRNDVNPVAETPEAEAMFEKYDRDVTAHMNGPSAKPTTKQLGNRAALKAMKLAAMLAVGVNPINPIVTDVEAKWAIDTVSYSTRLLEQRFERGDVGHGEAKQFADIRLACIWALKETQVGSTNEMKKAYIIPRRVLSRKTSGLESFKKDRIGATNAFDRCMKSLIADGVIQQISGRQAEQYVKRGAMLYFVSDPNWLLE